MYRKCPAKLTKMYRISDAQLKKRGFVLLKSLINDNYQRIDKKSYKNVSAFVFVYNMRIFMKRSGHALSAAIQTNHR